MAFNFSGGERARLTGSGQQTIGGNRITVHRPQGQMLAPIEGTGLSAAASIAMQFVDQKAKQLQLEKDQREIMRGMAMAAQGQAIDEIAKQDSWVNKIFGKTNLVDGARAYYQSHAANNILQDIQDHMPDLARMDPDQAQAKIQERVAFGVQTGDAMTDYHVSQQVLQKVPGLLKTQAKLNYEYKQQNILDAQRESFSSSIIVGAQAMQQMAIDPNTNPKDVAAAIQGVREALMPAPGQDREAWEGNVLGMIKSVAAMSGRPRTITDKDGNTVQVPANAWGLVAIRQSGVLDALPHDKLDDALKAMDAAEAKLKVNASERYADRVANLEAMVRQPKVGQTGQQIADQIDAMNRDYMRDTGSEAPLITGQQRAAYVGRSLDAITRANERELDRRERIRDRQIQHALRKKEIALAHQLAESAKIQKEADQASFVSLNRSQIGRFIARDPSLGKVVQKQMNADIDGAANEAERLQRIASWDTVHKGTQHDVQAAVKAMQANPEFIAKNPDAIAQQAQRFEAMRSMMGDEKASQYYGEQYKLMDNLMRSLKNGSSPAVAWQTATSSLSERFGRSDSAAKAADEIIKAEKGSAWAETFGLSGAAIPSDISDVSQERLKAAIGREYEEAFRETGSEAVATARAKRVITDPNGPVMVMGGLVLEAPKGMPRMDNWLSSSKLRGDNRRSIPAGQMREAVETAVTRRLLGKDGHKAALDQSVNWFFDNDASSTRISQTMVDGKPVFWVTALAEDGSGKEVSIAITADEIMDDYDRHIRPKGITGKISDAIGKSVERTLQGIGSPLDNPAAYQ